MDKIEEIFWNYFKYQNPSFLAKDLIRAKQDKNEQLINNINDQLIHLRNAFIEKKILENENPIKADIVERIREFNKQQKLKGIKILTPKQLLQRFPIALSHVEAGDTFWTITKWNQINHAFSLSRKKKLLKKYMKI